MSLTTNLFIEKNGKVDPLTSYEQMLNFLTKTAWIPAEKHGLENMMAICRLLGNPEKKFRSIHIAGTNGKGSVSLKIAKTLQYSNYRCGLFTSPHISNFRERVKIGDELISEAETFHYLSKIIAIAQEEKISLTYFEYCTLLAFEHFAARKVDLAVIEVGLGGLLDATNIILPLATIITSISKDHTELLGHTEEQIAVEKAGTIKPFIPVIIGPRAPTQVFEARAALLQAPLLKVTGEAAHYGIENQLIAHRAIDLLQTYFTLPIDAYSKALKIEPSCRFEVVSQETLQQSAFRTHGTLILDVAHNPDGISRLIQRLKLSYPDKNYHFGVNFSASKDIASCVEHILPEAKSLHILEVNHPRLVPSQQMSQLLADQEIPIFIGSPEAIFSSFLPKMTHQDVLVICGSFFIMGKIRSLLGYLEE